MKRLPKIIGLVLGLVVIIIAGVFVYESMIRSPRAAQKAETLKNYTLPSYSEGGKPKSSFPVASDSGSDVSPVADDLDGLQAQLEETQNVDSTSDIEALQAEAQGL